MTDRELRKSSLIARQRFDDGSAQYPSPSPDPDYEDDEVASTSGSSSSSSDSEEDAKSQTQTTAARSKSDEAAESQTTSANTWKRNYALERKRVNAERRAREAAETAEAIRITNNIANATATFRYNTSSWRAAAVSQLDAVHSIAFEMVHPSSEHFRMEYPGRMVVDSEGQFTPPWSTKPRLLHIAAIVDATIDHNNPVDNRVNTSKVDATLHELTFFPHWTIPTDPNGECTGEGLCFATHPERIDPEQVDPATGLYRTQWKKAQLIKFRGEIVTELNKIWHEVQKPTANNKVHPKREQLLIALGVGPAQPDAAKNVTEADAAKTTADRVEAAIRNIERGINMDASLAMCVSMIKQRCVAQFHPLVIGGDDLPFDPSMARYDFDTPCGVLVGSFTESFERGAQSKKLFPFVRSFLRPSGVTGGVPRAAIMHYRRNREGLDSVGHADMLLPATKMLASTFNNPMYGHTPVTMYPLLYTTKMQSYLTPYLQFTRAPYYKGDGSVCHIRVGTVLNIKNQDLKNQDLGPCLVVATAIHLSKTGMNLWMEENGIKESVDELLHESILQDVRLPFAFCMVLQLKRSDGTSLKAIRAELNSLGDDEAAISDRIHVVTQLTMSRPDTTIVQVTVEDDECDDRERHAIGEAKGYARQPSEPDLLGVTYAPIRHPRRLVFSDALKRVLAVQMVEDCTSSRDLDKLIDMDIEYRLWLAQIRDDLADDRFHTDLLADLEHQFSSNTKAPVPRWPAPPQLSREWLRDNLFRYIFDVQKKNVAVAIDAAADDSGVDANKSDSNDNYDGDESMEVAAGADDLHLKDGGTGTGDDGDGHADDEGDDAAQAADQTQAADETQAADDAQVADDAQAADETQAADDGEGDIDVDTGDAQQMTESTSKTKKKKKAKNAAESDGAKAADEAKKAATSKKAAATGKKAADAAKKAATKKATDDAKKAAKKVTADTRKATAKKSAVALTSDSDAHTDDGGEHVHYTPEQLATNLAHCRQVQREKRKVDDCEWVKLSNGRSAQAFFDQFQNVRQHLGEAGAWPQKVVRQWICHAMGSRHKRDSPWGIIEDHEHADVAKVTNNQTWASAVLHWLAKHDPATLLLFYICNDVDHALLFATPPFSQQSWRRYWPMSIFLEKDPHPHPHPFVSLSSPGANWNDIPAVDLNADGDAPTFDFLPESDADRPKKGPSKRTVSFRSVSRSLSPVKGHRASKKRSAPKESDAAASPKGESAAKRNKSDVSTPSRSSPIDLGFLSTGSGSKKRTTTASVSSVAQSMLGAACNAHIADISFRLVSLLCDRHRHAGCKKIHRRCQRKRRAMSISSRSAPFSISNSF